MWVCGAVPAATSVIVCQQFGAARARGAPWRCGYIKSNFNADWVRYLLYIAFVVYIVFAAGGIPQGWTHAA